MIIRGIEIDFSFTDIDDAKRFDNKYKAYTEKIAFINASNLKEVERVEAIFEAVKDMLVVVAGEENTEKLLKGKRDFMMLLEIIAEIIEVKKSTEEKLASLSNKAITKIGNNYQKNVTNNFNSGMLSPIM